MRISDWSSDVCSSDLRRMGAQIVAMVDRAFEQIGYGGEIDVRMRPHVHSLPDVEMRRAELVDEDEGADHRAGFVGQGSPHVEGADIVGRRGDNLHRHSPGASVLIASARTRRSEEHTSELPSLMRN